MSHTQTQEFWIFRMSDSNLKSAFHVPFVKDISSIERHPVNFFSILGVLQHKMPANIGLKRWKSRSFWQLIWCFVDLVLKREQFPGSKRTTSTTSSSKLTSNSQILAWSWQIWAQQIENDPFYDCAFVLLLGKDPHIHWAYTFLSLNKLRVLSFVFNWASISTRQHACHLTIAFQ